MTFIKCALFYLFRIGSKVSTCFGRMLNLVIEFVSLTIGLCLNVDNNIFVVGRFKCILYSYCKFESQRFIKIM